MPHDHVPAPLELARQLVLGGVDYARALGFEPHPDYADAVGHLDGPLTRCDIEFGRDGMPFFVEGPYDNGHQIMQSLDASVGPGNYPLPANGRTDGVSPPPDIRARQPRVERGRLAGAGAPGWCAMMRAERADHDEPRQRRQTRASCRPGG